MELGSPVGNSHVLPLLFWQTLTGRNVFYTPQQEEERCLSLLSNNLANKKSLSPQTLALFQRTMVSTTPPTSSFPL